ncbi:MAG: hypothetical protein ABSF08_08185 [Candidatus Cybelea sp.]
MILPIGGRFDRLGAPARSWMKANIPPHPLVYVSDYDGNFVNIYSANGTDQTPIGQLTGFNEPQGLWVDLNQNLWVVNTNTQQIIGFHRNRTSPFKTFDDTSGNYPVGVCGNNNKNLMYVVDIVSLPPYGPANTIEVYDKAGSSSPIEILTDNNAQALYQCAVDSRGNLFVTLTPVSNPYGSEVDEFPRGSTTPTVLINTGLVYALGITVDKYNALAVDDAFANASTGEVYIYDPPYTNGSAHSFAVPQGVDQTALNKQQTQLWGSNAFDLDAQQYSYPVGLLQNSTSTEDLIDPSGIALSPAAKQ